LISFGYNEEQRGELLRLRPLEPQPIVVSSVSGGNVRYMISPSIKLIAASTSNLYEVVSPLTLLSGVTTIDLNYCTLLACTTIPSLAVSMAQPVLSEMSILNDSEGRSVRGFWKLSQVISKVALEV